MIVTQRGLIAYLYLTLFNLAILDTLNLNSHVAVIALAFATWVGTKPDHSYTAISGRNKRYVPRRGLRGRPGS